MTKTPYLPLYYNDLRGATQDWTDEEFGAYVRLLIYQWDQGFIPTEMSRLVKIADSTEKNWPVLSQKFTPGEPGFLKNSVMEKIRGNNEKFSQKQSANIKKRWKKEKLNSSKRSTNKGFNGDTKLIPKRYPRVESEYEYEDKDKDKGLLGEKEKVLLPFTSENFRVLWQNWKLYRKQEFKQTFKSGQSEQAALTHLAKISDGNEKMAEDIINQSIANQWKGLFEIKNTINGSRQNGYKTAVSKGKSTGADELLEELRANRRT